MVLVTEMEAVAALRGAGCVFAEEEAAILAEAADGSEDALAELVGRRATGEPLEQVVGFADFCGVRVKLRPGVFVPRVRSELLVRAAVQRAGDVVVDLCCGSGALGLAIRAQRPATRLYAADVDPVAVRCARRNVGPHGGVVVQGNLDAPLPAELRGRIDVLVANAPYVPTGAVATMPPEAREHEARVALDGGVDGLDVQRRVAAVAPRWLAPGGHLLIETSEEQAPRTAAAVTAAGLAARIARDDDLDATVVIGTAPSRPA